jgi:hypothetical protein
MAERVIRVPPHLEALADAFEEVLKDVQGTVARRLTDARLPRLKTLSDRDATQFRIPARGPKRLWIG